MFIGLKKPLKAMVFNMWITLLKTYCKSLLNKLLGVLSVYNRRFDTLIYMVFHRLRTRHKRLWVLALGPIYPIYPPYQHKQHSLYKYNYLLLGGVI